MPSGKQNLDQVLMPTLCFGDISRDEINTVLNIAGVPLTPPTKTPFVTGIQPRKPVVIHTPIVIEQKLESVHATPTSVPVQQVQSTLHEPKLASAKPSTAAEKQPKTATNKKESTAKQSVQKQQPTQQQPQQPQQPQQQAQEPPSPQPKPNNKPVVSSWASLLKTADTVKKPASPAATHAMTNGKLQQSQQPNKPSKPSSPTPSVVPKFTGVADIINKYEPNYSAPLIQPRGLINNVNTCFMNVILQPLSHCAPFYNLIKTISNQAAHSIKSKTPLLDSIIEFINEFPAERLDQMEPYGEPFVPEYVYNALRGQKKFDTLRGRQEDSEEFLCFLLDGLHEEMTSVLNDKRKEAENSEEWLEVGAKNKTSNLRSTGFEESPVSKIFGGKVRSVLRCPGAKDSINLEPFQSLPLDIQPDNVHSIEDAIANMTVPETMHDYTSPKGIKVDATKQVYLESLPPVLILHMKRFVFDGLSGNVQKLSKKVNYSAKLTIDPEWMAAASRPNEPYTYQLFGCVYHHGTSAGGGHYTCDIKRRNGEWLHIDDTTITSVSEQDVTEDNTRTSERLHADQTAYILFYVRSC
ncbi:uncharacterized protein B0P05DRAFT_512183 [Gilbertella persicaria]|uniref:uncharacterized protein n=1 Tax=Gilbertella persicaria TaxID=101096 RepID=UPI002220FCF4|nr:uncharacterized protein B0P05DRAFT_512183 [Gilbertella persicaria]KAI8075836.1 hypothetical protein B0P05DRAFT_512183 [Gilbertella persicaria]